MYYYTFAALFFVREIKADATPSVCYAERERVEIVSWYKRRKGKQAAALTSFATHIDFALSRAAVFKTQVEKLFIQAKRTLLYLPLSSQKSDPRVPDGSSVHEFFTTPTFAARSTRPFKVYPLLCV